MAQGDYLIQNQGFPAFRSDLNSTLEAINTSNSGTSRPTSAVAGTIWLDTTNATNPTLKFFDGNDDISLATIDYSANTVNWLNSSVVADLVNDSTPQLGGNLDVNGNSIVSVSNGNITFTPDGTGKVIIDGLSFPTSDGTANQVLKTDGSGNLSFDTVSTAGTVLTTQGDILYRDGSGLQRLGAGTSGQALITGGAGANPSWGDVSGGKVLQVVTDSSDSNFTTSSTTYSYVTNMPSLSITPSASTSKILLLASLGAGEIGGGNGYITIYRDSTDIGSATGQGLMGFEYATENLYALGSMITLDSPSSTSSITYQLRIKSSGGSSFQFGNAVRISLTAIEIGV